MVQVVLKDHEPEWAVLFVQARTQIEAALGKPVDTMTTMTPEDAMALSRVLFAPQ